MFVYEAYTTECSGVLKSTLLALHVLEMDDYWLLLLTNHFLLALKTGLMCCQLKLQPVSLHQKLKTQGVQQPVFSKLFRVKPTTASLLAERGDCGVKGESLSARDEGHALGKA